MRDLAIARRLGCLADQEWKEGNPEIATAATLDLFASIRRAFDGTGRSIDGGGREKVSDQGFADVLPSEANTEADPHLAAHFARHPAGEIVYDEVEAVDWCNPCRE